MSLANLVVMVYGRKGSGKSKYLWDTYTGRAPRKISLFAQPEDRSRFVNAIQVVGWSAFLDALVTIERESVQRWHLDLMLEQKHIARLFAMLTPEYGGDGSLAQALGGVAIDCGELHMLAPNGRTPAAFSGALFRSRHWSLDMNLATQRPASVSLDVRTQADVTVCFALEGKRDRAAVAETMQLDDDREIAALPMYWCIRRDVASGRTVLLDPARREVREINAARPTVETGP